MERSNPSRPSDVYSGPIHGLVIAICRDYREIFSRSRRASDRLYKVLMPLYGGFIDSSCSLSWSIDQVKKWETELLHWNGHGHSITYCGVSLCPVEDYALLRFLRQWARFFWKSSGRSPLASPEAEAAHRHRTGGPSHSLSKEELQYCRDMATHLLGPAPDLLDLYPRHGPGAVAGGEKGLRKWEFSKCFSSLLPYGGPKLYSWNPVHTFDVTGSMTIARHPTTRYVEVPKDARANRVISCEPKELQFLQQALLPELVRRLEHSSKGQIQFVSQEKHTELMLNKHYRYATLDLSNASDNVSRRLVWNILPTDWRDMLFALRSQFVQYPTMGVIPLRTFAPMGSALCFPIEALVHYLLIRLVTSAKVSVYGDDLIVPRVHAPDIMGVLSRAGLEPNVGKCCVSGFMRETCGTDILLFPDEEWVPITVKYFRGNFVKLTVKDLPNCIEMVRHTMAMGYKHASAFLYGHIHSMIGDRVSNHWFRASDDNTAFFPVIPGCNAKPPASRFNKWLHRIEYMTPLISVRTVNKVPDGYNGLLSSLRSHGLRSEVSYRPPRARARTSCKWLPAS